MLTLIIYLAAASWGCADFLVSSGAPVNCSFFIRSARDPDPISGIHGTPVIGHSAQRL